MVTPGYVTANYKASENLSSTRNCTTGRRLAWTLLACMKRCGMTLKPKILLVNLTLLYLTSSYFRVPDGTLLSVATLQVNHIESFFLKIAKLDV